MLVYTDIKNFLQTSIFSKKKMILLRILNCMDVSQATILENEYFPAGTLLSPAFFISPSNAEAVPAGMIRIKSYLYLFFLLCFLRRQPCFLGERSKACFVLSCLLQVKWLRTVKSYLSYYVF